MAFAGLYGDLPSAKDQPSDDADKEKKKEGWAGSGLFAPTNLGGKRQGEGSGRRLHLQPASGGPSPPRRLPPQLTSLHCAAAPLCSCPGTSVGAASGCHWRRARKRA